MPWLSVFVAGVLEVVWATSLKQSQGFTRLWPSVVTIGAMLLSFAFLANAMKTLPLGVTYAVWTGIGVVGAAIAGMLLLREPVDPLRLFFIACIVAGIFGLRLTVKA